VDANGWPTYQTPKKYCRKLQPPEYGARALPTDDRQTDGQATAYSEREREFTFTFKFTKKQWVHAC